MQEEKIIISLQGMKKIAIYSILMMISLVGVGQSTVILSSKHKAKLSKITDPYEHALKYKKYYLKDSLKQQKFQLKKQGVAKGKELLKDSLNTISGAAEYPPMVDELLQIDSTTLANKAKELGSKTAKGNFDANTSSLPKDSTEVIGLAKDKANQQIKEMSGVETSRLALDSTLVDSAKKETSQQLQNISGVDISAIATDSTMADGVKKEVKKQALDKVRDQDVIKENQELLNVVSLDSLGSISADTVAVRAKDAAVNKGEELLKNTDEYKELNGLDKDSEFGKLTEQKAKLEKTQEEFRKATAQNELKKQMTSKAKDYITKNSKQIQQVQSKMTDLKKKYSSVPNSNDLSTATKRTSLKGESFWKRLVLGGNFNITKTNPVTMDLSPVLGYRINKLFEAGISATYRVQFKVDKNAVIKDDAVYGQGVWANHLFYKNYFGHIEGERVSTVVAKDGITTRSWKESLLIGVGRKFKVAKWLEMQALVLFNPLYDNQDQLYSSPVVFRTGFRIIK